jgi:MoxR-like ATPase
MTVKTKRVPKENDRDALLSRLQTIREEMCDSLIERDDEVDLVLTALLAEEHPLLVGPPGTAKSLLLDSLMRVIGGSTSFSILFNKFTTPEEVFGPISVQGLKQDVYRRVTTGKLPEAEFAFADEIFKASTAILNTMLRILNERVYENGDGKFRKVPLLLCVGASNEWPGEDGGKELGALFDRFLFRKRVRPIASAANRKRLLFGAVDHTPTFTEELSVTEIAFLTAEVKRVDFTDAAKDAMMGIIKSINQEGIFPGDRRMFKSVKAARAYALLEGSDEVEPVHLDILAHTLWDDPNEQPEKVAKIVAKVANPEKYAINEQLMMIDSIVENSPVHEAVQKLQSMRTTLQGFQKSARQQDALAIVNQRIKDLYNTIVHGE